MIRFAQTGLAQMAIGALGCAAMMAHGATVAQESAASAEPQANGVLGDDFARESGAIIVTGQRHSRGNLFEEVPLPDESCLASAPALGAGEPGFVIDGSVMRRVRDLERIRKQTKAGTIFVSGGNFVGADFRKARLDNMCFFNADFSQTNWAGFSGTGLGFINVDLTGANMARSTLPFVLLRNATLALVNARAASWQNGQIDGGWGGSLRALDLTGANLTGFRIACGTSADDGCPTDRDGMSLAGANLRRASFHSFFWPDINLKDARIDQTELALYHLRGLDDALLVGPVVLRSPRRAIMLFPGEVAQLAKVAQRGDDSANICAAPLDPAETLACEASGTEVRTLLQSVAQLTVQTAGNPAAQRNAPVWEASRNYCLQLPSEDAQLGCVLQTDRDREALLRALAGTPDWLAEPGYRLFLSSEAAYPTTRGQRGLYGRILPILLDSAVAVVIVKSDGTGTIAAKGQALGGCSFEAEGLRFDAESANLNIVITPRRRRTPAVEAPLLTLAGSNARVVGEGLARYPGCTVDNGYPRLEEVALDDALLESIWRRF